MRVKELLKQKGMTAKELASKIGISEGALSQSIKDGANPNLQTITKIAAALGVDITELFAKRGDFVAFIDHRGKLYRCDSINENRVLLDRLEAEQSGK